MASVSAQDTHAAAAMLEVKEDSSTPPPLKEPISANAVDTPPDTPTAEPSSPTSICAQETVDNDLEQSHAQVTHISHAETSEHLGVGREIEQGLSTASQVDVKEPDFEGTETIRPTVAAANEDANLAEKEEPCKLETEQLCTERALPTAEADASVQPKLNISDGKDVGLGITDDKYADGGSKQGGAIQSSDDESFRGVEDTVLDMSQQINTAPEPPRSVPPHMRENLKPSSVQGSIDRRRDWPAQTPRGPRAHFPAQPYAPSRPPLDYDELRSTRLQLMKARSDLEAEKKVNAEMRKTVGAETQASIGAAMSDMLVSLLQKQADALTAKAKAQEKERELKYREEMIAQLEVYLSDGQKQLKYKLEQNGIRLMSEVDAAKLGREVELKVKHQLSDIEGKIAIQVERLRHQEAAQKIREQQYEVLIRDALEDDIREQLAREMQAKMVDSKATDAAYARGLIDGKRTGDSQASELALKHEFLKGFAACQRAQTALHNMRIGRLAADSPELAFLYDPTHAENPHNIGVGIGRMTAGAAVSSTVDVVIARASPVAGSSQAAAKRNELQACLTPVTVRGHGQAQRPDARTSQAADRQEQVRPTQQTLPQPLQREELALRPAPPRPTFAGELRSASTPVSNGVFAGNSTPSSAPNASKTSTVSTGSAPRAGMAGHMGEGVYAGRRLIRYEDSEDEPDSPNLIDLY